MDLKAPVRELPEEAEARLALERAEGSQRRVETLEAEALLSRQLLELACGSWHVSHMCR